MKLFMLWKVKEELLNLDTEVSDDKFKIPNSLLREIVRNGTEDIDGIVEKVLEVYQDIYPDLKSEKIWVVNEDKDCSLVVFIRINVS